MHSADLQADANDAHGCATQQGQSRPGVLLSIPKVTMNTKQQDQQAERKRPNSLGSMFGGPPVFLMYSCQKCRPLIQHHIILAVTVSTYYT